MVKYLPGAGDSWEDRRDQGGNSSRNPEAVVTFTVLVGDDWLTGAMALYLRAEPCLLTYWKISRAETPILREVQKKNPKQHHPRAKPALGISGLQTQLRIC